MLSAHVSPYSHAYSDMAQSLQSMMQAGGGSAAEALTMANAVIAARLEQQATLLAYLDNFVLLAAVFGLLIPLVFLMRRPPAVDKPAPAH
jgi:DHA2 family multidrug resistance protein